MSNVTRLYFFVQAINLRILCGLVGCSHAIHTLLCFFTLIDQTTAVITEGSLKIAVWLCCVV